MESMSFLKDEGGQGGAEYMLLLGGVIIVAIAAILIYKPYFDNMSLTVAKDVGSVRGNLTNNSTGKVPIGSKPPIFKV
jgi:hypothetical protein